MAILVERPPSRAWLRTTLVAAAGLLLGIASFCAAVDPYGIIGTPTIPGLTDRKIAAAPRSRLTKPYRIEQVNPAAIVIGSSAANIGFDPDSPAWTQPDRPVFNLGIDGASFDVQQRFLQHALVRARPRLVVISVSFEDMMLAPRTLRSASPGDPNAFEDRMRVDAEGRPNRLYPLARLADLVFATLSLRAVLDSVATLMDQDDPEQNVQTPAGFDVRAQFPAWIARDGTRTVIALSLRQRLSELLRTESTMQRELEHLASMVRTARAAGAEVAVVVMPAYVAGLEVRRRLGLTARSQAWLADMVRTVEDAAGGPDHVAIWNFEGYDTPVQQPLPAAKDSTPLRWFWEAVHFRPELGTLMLRRIAGEPGLPGFGTRLTATTVAEQSRRYVEAERHWVAANPGDADALLEMIRTALDATCKRSPAKCRPPPALLP